MSAQGNNITAEQDGDVVVVTVHEVTPQGVMRAAIRLPAEQAAAFAGVLEGIADVVRFGPGPAEGSEVDEGQTGHSAQADGLVTDPNDKVPE